MSSSLLSAAGHVARCFFFFGGRAAVQTEAHQSRVVTCTRLHSERRPPQLIQKTFPFLLNKKFKNYILKSQPSFLLNGFFFFFVGTSGMTMITLHNTSRSTKTKINSKRGAFGIKMQSTRTVTTKQQLKD